MEFKGTKNDLWQVSEFEDILEVISGNYPLICSFPVNDYEGKANAKLISKAPEMLEMLIDIRDWIDKDINVSECRTQIDELIKEATEI